MTMKNKMTIHACSILVDHCSSVPSLDLCQKASSFTHHCSCVINANGNTVEKQTNNAITLL